jgi:hypothetical protein
MREGAGAAAISARLVAPMLLGQRCWVRWPYLQEALVTAVSDAGEKARTPRTLLGF